MHNNSYDKINDIVRLEFSVEKTVKKNVWFTDEIRAEQGSLDSVVLFSVSTIFLAVSMMFSYVYFKRRWVTSLMQNCFSLFDI